MASRKVPDFYARRARELGYAARSAFKLLEMHEKFRVVKGSVLDLGSHPGAWLQVASRAMPPDAFALGVDLQETSLENMRHVDATRVRVVRRPPADCELRRHLCMAQRVVTQLLLEVEQPLLDA